MQNKHTETNPGAASAAPRLERPPLIEAQKARVRQIMSHPAISARPDMSVETVVELILREGLSRLPVVTEDRKLVGMISKTDLLTERFDRGDTSEPEGPGSIGTREGVSLVDPGFHIHQPEAAVSEVMKPALVTVNETSTIAQAAELMAVHQVHGVPVVDASGRVTGMLSLLDIVGWVAGLV